MVKKLKKGTTGNAAQYVTRNQALKKLQLKLSQFRRLCILKGIHPREPKKKPHGQHKTYYHVKDINYLQHEPLVKKFREIYAYQKKVKRVRAKQNKELLQRLLNRKPTYKLDHLVRERYPSFVDALRDLDDPLTLVHLFAVLPAEQQYDIPAKLVQVARRLALEFQAYIVRTHALRRVFVSVKGFYYQAEVHGQSVTWLTPHNTSQVLPTDVDYRVMVTFLEFYETLLQFVNFKLYHALGVRYPPVLDPKLEAAAAELSALMQQMAGESAAPTAPLQVEGVSQQVEVNKAAVKRLADLPHKLKDIQRDQQHIQQTVQAAAGTDHGPADSDSRGDAEVSDHEDGSEAGSEDAAPGSSALAVRSAPNGHADGSGDASVSGAAGGAVGVDANDDAAICGALFKGLVFFLGREVPREQLLFVIRAFGGEAGWQGEGSPVEENEERITHQVVDRPTQGHRYLSREYVQPQWVFDSANFRVLVPTDLYAPAMQPPPHLSPFVDDEEEGYVPDYKKTIKQLQEAAAAVRQHHSGQLSEDTFVGEQQDAAAAVQDDAAAQLLAAELQYNAELAKEMQAAAGAPAAEDDANDDDDDQAFELGVDELVGTAAASAAAASKQLHESHEAEEAERTHLTSALLSRKKRRLYEASQHKDALKKARVEKLQQRKRALTKKQGKAK